jgi:hypothetical protein
LHEVHSSQCAETSEQQDLPQGRSVALACLLSFATASAIKIAHSYMQSFSPLSTVQSGIQLIKRVGFSCEVCYSSFR